MPQASNQCHHSWREHKTPSPKNKRGRMEVSGTKSLFLTMPDNSLVTPPHAMVSITYSVKIGWSLDSHLKKCLHLSFPLATASGISCDYNCSSSWQIMTSTRNPNSGEILASSFLIGKEISDVGNGKLTSSWPVLDHCHPSLSSNSTSLVIDKFSSIASSLSSSDAGCSLPAEHMKTLGRRCSTAVLVSCLLEMKSLLVSVLFVRRVSRAFGEPAGAVLVLWNLCNSKAVQNLADWTAETDLRWVLGISDRVVNWGREEELWAVRHSNSIFSCYSF